MSCQMLQDVFGCFALLSFCIDFEKAMLRQGGAGLAAEEQGVAKPRGRGRGRRNINQWRFLTEQGFCLFLANKKSLPNWL